MKVQRLVFKIFLAITHGVNSSTIKYLHQFCEDYNFNYTHTHKLYLY